MDVIEFLEMYHATLQIPITLYEKSKIIKIFDDTPFLPNPAQMIMAPALSPQPFAAYTVSPDFLLCGVLPLESSGEQWLLVGPAPLAECNKNQVSQILQKLGQPATKVHHMMTWLNHMPICSHFRFLNIIRFLDYTLNQQQNREIIQITADNPSPPQPPDTTDFTYGPLQDANFEKQVYSCIRYGKYKELKQILDNISIYNMGMPAFSTDSLRAFKNIFIYSTVMAAYMSRQGGVDYHLANNLSEKYLSRIEPLNSYEEIHSLWTTMLLDFTRRALLHRITISDSLLVSRICREVLAHLYDKISVHEIALTLNLSQEHISREFKKHTGKTVSYFIQECKIEEAKRLLEITDLSLSQIASQLQYSSQSYFQSVFKKTTGKTPIEYKDQAFF